MSRHTGYASLPLHPGKAPAWLFGRMTRLAREITAHVVADRGPEEMLRRLADPFWFQAFGCVLGFDWHSSGVTTTVTGALKEGIKGLEHELGFYAQGGKGMTSRKTPSEIVERCDQLSIDPKPLVYASRMAAKVDSAAVQDGYQLYHHTFFFTRAGHWSVVQQGMSDETGTARRYHWLSESIHSFVNEPHEAICSDTRVATLNLVAGEHEPIRDASVQLATGAPDRVMDVVRRYAHGGPRRTSGSASALRLPFDEAPTLDMPKRHALMLQDVDPRHLQSVLLSTYDRAPENFETPRGRGRAHAAGAGAGVGSDLGHTGEHARPRAVRVRARRQGRHPLPRRPRDLRQDDRRAASRDGEGARRSQRKSGRAEAPRALRQGHRTAPLRV